MENPVLLSIKNLKIDFINEKGITQAVRGIHLDVHEGEIVGLVGIVAQLAQMLMRNIHKSFQEDKNRGLELQEHWHVSPNLFIMMLIKLQLIRLAGIL